MLSYGCVIQRYRRWVRRKAATEDDGRGVVAALVVRVLNCRDFIGRVRQFLRAQWWLSLGFGSSTRRRAWVRSHLISRFLRSDSRSANDVSSTARPTEPLGRLTGVEVFPRSLTQHLEVARWGLAPMCALRGIGRAKMTLITVILVIL